MRDGWFAPAFAGQQILTFQEVIDRFGKRAGLCVELKDLEAYEAIGVDQLGLFAAALKSNNLDHPGPGLSLVMQSFHEPTLRRAADVFDRRLPSTLLVEAVDALKWSRPGRACAKWRPSRPASAPKNRRSRIGPSS